MHFFLLYNHNLYWLFVCFVHTLFSLIYSLWIIFEYALQNLSYKKIIMCFKRWQIPVVLLTKVLWPDAEDLVLTKSVHQADQVSIIIISTIPNQCMNCTHNYFWFFPHFLPDYDKEHTGGETGQQRMFPPPWQLIVA